ncbi:Telomerase reverse transcriptase [Conoideocrella luteorostrata]|uniref:Telomerase reverse transcriptase n=1 Tax=Conoideocrella luteorostrata TaxID=1105319 RepID=A0AAJ0FVM5_9HYPO|nr:Telomerase reverse transcriptase [Conoideocrella luteorostrata]
MARRPKRKRSEPDVCSPQEKITHDGPVKRDLLGQTYTTCLTLRQYALLKLPSSSRLRRKKIAYLGRGDCITELEAKVSKFLDSTLVCSCKAISQNDDATFDEWLAFSQRGDDSLVSLSGGLVDSENIQSEIVDFVIWLLFSRERRPGCWPKHILCDGFRKRSKEGDPSGISISDVYSRFPNHHAMSLRQGLWAHLLALLGRSGQKIMSDLLIERSIFVPIDAGIGNYYQLSGIPLSELDLTGKPRIPHEPRGLSDISLVRNRIFYAKPTLTARGRIQPGFKHIHVLNRCPYIKHRRETTDNDKNDLATTKVMMYMFPRQFGLHNVFTSSVNSLETAQKFQDYTLREDEIANLLKDTQKHSSLVGARTKIPKRLRGTARTIVRKLQILHGSCSYAELLKHYCSSKLDKKHSRKESGSGKLAPRISPPQELEIAHQGSGGPATRWNPEEIADSLSREGAFQFNSLVELATPTSQVSAFCQAVLSNIVPNSAWGEGDIMVHNKATVLRHVDHFVKLRRFESMTLHEISQGLKIADIAWLQPPGLQGQKASKTDVTKRHEIFNELLYYVFDSLLIPLIRTNFYVTESNTHRYQIFYFRHDIWRRIAQPALSMLKKEMFDEIKLNDANEILSSRRLGFSQLRLLPKGNKLRPIMNLRRRQINNKRSRVLGPSINSVLGPIYTALKFEKDANPHKMGSTLFSVGDMYERLKKFKQAIGSVRETKLYFAKVDVQSAFDTIPQAAVIQLMESIPSQQQYIISKHAEVQPGERAMIELEKTGTNAIRRWHSSVLAQGKEVAFTSRLQEGIANKKKNTVFVGGVAQTSHDTNVLMHLMADHIQRNLVKVGKKYYRQKRGIPQGSVLSSFLCNYFYADLESKQLAFLNGPDCLLMRLIDDFLLITLDKDKATNFVETMHRGVPEYGVEVSPKKTLVNFDMQLHGESVCKATSRGFPYCGTRINDQTLEITKDIEIGKAFAVANSLTVDFGRSPGQNFQRKILNAFKIQSHLMFYDTSHNVASTVLESLHHAFNETARKLWAYVRCLEKTQRPSTSLIIQTICKVAEVAFSIMSSKSRRIRYPGYACTIRRGQVTSIAYRAFLAVLSKHQANYASVIEWLRKQNKRLPSM